MLKQPEMFVTPAIVEFVDFETYKLRAQDIADFVSSVEVTPDTVKSSKKLIAETRKIVDALNKERLSIKKRVLADYETFESQIRQLQKILDSADQTVRFQVKELEDKEREEKKTQIEEIWKKRLLQYDFGAIPDLFEKVYRPAWTNKTMSLTKVEKEMVNALEAIQKDYETISLMPDSDEVFTEYIRTLDLADALQQVRGRAETKIKARKILREVEDPDTVQATFLIIGQKNISLAEYVLKANDIEFYKSNDN